MASRVERYYDKNIDINKRSLKNRELYKTIYEDETYSNIEGIVETPKTNEIDIKKIQELLLKQEKEYKTRNQLVKKELEIPDMETLDDHENKNYDIRDILAQAKEEQEEDDDKPRSLKDIDFDGIRKRISTAEKYEVKDAEKDLQELKELISTIAGSNSELNKLADKDLSLDMFADLAASTNEISKEDSDVIKKIIAEAKQIEEDSIKSDLPIEVDKSFYTSTLKLKKKDFESEDEEEEKSVSLAFKITVIILIIIIAVAAVVVGYNILK